MLGLSALMMIRSASRKSKSPWTIKKARLRWDLPFGAGRLVRWRSTERANAFSVRCPLAARQRRGASFSALATAKAQGWSALDSDEAVALYQDWETGRLTRKLEGLDLQALGSDTASLVKDLLGDNSASEALNWYTAGAYSDFGKAGMAGFDGFAQVWTAGADYRFSGDFVLGGNLNYEYGKLDFDTAEDGRLTKQGWRADAYAGWTLGAGLAGEGLLSYGQFENQIITNFDEGWSDSQRWMASLGLVGDLDWLGVRARPYGRLVYSKETFDAYVITGGQTVPGFDTEFSQVQGGLELRAPQAAFWGLEPYLALQGEWDWRHAGSQTLASGAVLEPDDWGLSWVMGLNGRLDGFLPGTWYGGLMEGALVDVRLQNSDFGRDIDARSLQWSLTIPLD